MIIWDDSLTTGLSDIDDQHKELIQNFNNLLEAIDQGKDREETGKVLDFLTSYAESHFEHEERLMDEYDCPVAGANKKAHEYFRTKFGQICKRYHEADANVGIIHDTVWELAKWFLNHILIIDTKLHACVPSDQPDDD